VRGQDVTAFVVLEGEIPMSKYDEIYEMAQQAAIEVRTYQQASITFIETLAGAWGAYIEEAVSLVSIEDAQSPKTLQPIS
jgi:hypothetical protein